MQEPKKRSAQFSGKMEIWIEKGAAAWIVIIFKETRASSNVRRSTYCMHHESQVIEISKNKYSKLSPDVSTEVITTSSSGHERGLSTSSYEKLDADRTSLSYFHLRTPNKSGGRRGVILVAVALANQV